MSAEKRVTHIHFDKIIKPLAAFERLMKILTPNACSHPISNTSKIINWVGEGEAKEVVLFTHGVLNVYRKTDNLLFAQVTAPGIFGLMSSQVRQDLYLFKADFMLNVLSLPQNKAIEIITEHNEVQNMLKCYAYYHDYQAYRNNMLINMSSYDIVCILLKELEAIPLSERLNISTTNFIHERSMLARSGVMKILSHLRDGNYIEMHKGKLIQLLKRFPETY